ncbi:MAG: hypothetical protein HW405_820 [Candidatus Berkelbacteria bacterium]|nr:hypothetical protein [Candidatus Berkelbacteria bacterium]
MYQSFLAIIALLGAVYCLFTRQVKIGLGYFIYAIAFILLLPNLTEGIKTDILSAIAMVLFVIGTLVIAWKKIAKKDIAASETQKNANA